MSELTTGMDARDHDADRTAVRGAVRGAVPAGLGSADAGARGASPEAALRLLGLVAAGSVLLGLTMQIALVAARALAGGASPGARLLVDLAGAISWSTLVCSGLAVAVVIARARAALAGLVGLVCAPLAVAVAKSAQKLVAEMSDAAQVVPVLPLAALGLARAVEYGVLAYALARLAQAGETRLLPYAGLGLATGVVFGGAIAALTAQAGASAGAPLPTPALVAMTVNEVAFPVGCALVIAVAQLAARALGMRGP